MLSISMKQGQIRAVMDAHHSSLRMHCPRAEPAHQQTYRHSAKLLLCFLPSRCCAVLPTCDPLLSLVVLFSSFWFCTFQINISSTPIPALTATGRRSRSRQTAGSSAAGARVGAGKEHKRETGASPGPAWLLQLSVRPLLTQK